jgi:hypothetical protein
MKLRRMLSCLWLIASLSGAAVAQPWHAMAYRADAPGIDENPLRGFVPYSYKQPNSALFPHSLEWFYLPLSAVVAGPGAYDWRPLEDKLTAIAGRGHQAIFRFYLDYPKQPSGIPRYLLDAGLKTFAYDDGGNAQSPTPSRSPDYSDPRLIACMTDFLRALGAKYDGDPRIAFFQVGLYGFWGEWHVHQHPLPGEPAGWQIAPSDKDALLRAAIESFHKTPVEVRQPGVTANRALLSRFGFHDDSFLQDTLGPAAWQFWPKMVAAGTTESWKSLPTGGELRPELQAEVWNQWPNAVGQDASQAIATIHATWMLDAALFKAAPGTPAWANALRAQRMLGYTFYCTAARLERVAGGQTRIMLRVENRGVAPFYYSWPAELEAQDATGKVVATAQAHWPLPSLVPHQTAEWSAVFNIAPKRIRRVLVQIPNPMPGGHPIAFANSEMGTARPGWLTLEVSDNR